MGPEPKIDHRFRAMMLSYSQCIINPLAAAEMQPTHDILTPICSAEETFHSKATLKEVLCSSFSKLKILQLHIKWILRYLIRIISEAIRD